MFIHVHSVYNCNVYTCTLLAKVYPFLSTECHHKRNIYIISGNYPSPMRTKY